MALTRPVQRLGLLKRPHHASSIAPTRTALMEEDCRRECADRSNKELSTKSSRTLLLRLPRRALSKSRQISAGSDFCNLAPFWLQLKMSKLGKFSELSFVESIDSS